MIRPFRNSATAYYEQTLQFGQQGQWWSKWQVHAANALHRAWPTEHPTPQVDWAPARNEILASISTSNPEGTAARIANAKTNIEINAHDLNAYTELVGPPRSGTNTTLDPCILLESCMEPDPTR